MGLKRLRLFQKSPPSPLMKGRGIKGEGLVNNQSNTPCLKKVGCDILTNVIANRRMVVAGKLWIYRPISDSCPFFCC